MAKILLVDDDHNLVTELSEILKDQNYVTEFCHSGDDALQMLDLFKFDLIILDQNMPGLTGLQVCKRFRESGGNTPIIFLSGETNPSTKATGLDFGGDDYIVKPFEPIELLARVKAIFRRGGQLQSNSLKSGGFVLDTNRLTISTATEVVVLTHTESNLLEFFFRNQNRFFSSNQVLESVWPSDSKAGDDAVRVLMYGLRRKFAGKAMTMPIRTVKGSGYICDPGDQELK